MASSQFNRDSLGSRIANISQDQPENIAIIHNGVSISYKDLYSRVQSLSGHLKAVGIKPDFIVGISTRHGSDHIIAQLAVIHAGAICLPFDGVLPLSEIQTRMQAVNAKYIIIDNEIQNGLGDITTIALGSIRPVQDASPPYTTGPDFQSHILFSSGTTGLPKAIQIPGCGISNLADDEMWEPVKKSGRFGHINSTGFDASIIDIWVALLLGATIVVLDRKKLLNPAEFAAQLKDESVTVLLLTASVFKKISSFYSNAFREVEILLVGGELPHIAACRRVLEEKHRPKQLINAYGPTECSVVAFVHEVQMDDLDSNQMPLGRPIHGIDYFIIDEEDNIINTESNTTDDDGNFTNKKSGELCLGGTSLSRGYVTIDSSTTNADQFFTLPNPKDPKESIRLYRTGDIIKIHDGYMAWSGRKSLEFKFDGHRIQPAEIEKALRETRLVDDVLTLKFTNPATNIEYLISCVVYGKSAVNFERLWAKMRKWQARHTVTQVIEFDAFPQNNNGKNDREATTEKLEIMLKTRHQKIQSTNLYKRREDDFDTWQIKRDLTRIWARILISVPMIDINDESDFYLLGGTSMLVTTLLGEIQKHFRVVLSTHTLGNEIIFGKQVEHIKGDHGHDDAAVLKNMNRDLEYFMEANPSPRPFRYTTRLADEINVLLTGATGFIGAFLLQELLQEATIKKVFCLIRAKTQEKASGRLLANLEKYNISLDEHLKSKIEFVPGDFSQPMLDLTTIAYYDLARQTDIIYHLGAQVNYVQPYTSHVNANVIGTHHMIRFACDVRQKPLHYVSSVSAFGPTGLMTGNDPIAEDDDLQPYLYGTMQYEGGYGQSQWVADQMVSRFMRQGFPAAIYRPGFVLCHSGTGAGNPDDFMGRLISDCVTLRSYPALSNQRKELIAVDNVAKILKVISLSERNLGHAYHITPHINESLDMENLFDVIGTLCDITMESLPYPEWLERLKNLSPSRLSPILLNLEEKVTDNRTRWELYENMARFRTDNTLRALGDANEDTNLLATVSDVALRGYLRNCLQIDTRNQQPA